MSRLDARMRHILVLSDFFEAAEDLRRAFDSHFEDHVSCRFERFIWDYWYVPGMFTYLRALPQTIFTEELLQPFLTRLRDFGRERLACRSIYLPTLNCHIEDCWHNLHADADKGPWAFVFSLTDWNARRFRGGETMVLNPDALDYWRSSARQRREPVQLFRVICPLFNQMTIFDAQLVHGVNRVSGTHDPVEGRLTLAGWFADPGVVVGDASSGVADQIESCRLAVQKELRKVDDVAGNLVVRLKIGAEGAVTASEMTVNSLVALGGDYGRAEQVEQAIIESMRTARFTPSVSGTWAAVPFSLPT
jgi:2OG-Fe(II) oxygenase superfamily